MQNKCCTVGCFIKNSRKTHAHYLVTLMILPTLFHCGHLLFTWKTHCGLKFHFGQFDRSEICTKMSFTPPNVMWTLIMKWPYTEVKFYPKVKSQTGLSSLRVSCKCALMIEHFFLRLPTFFKNAQSFQHKVNLHKKKTWEGVLKESYFEVTTWKEWTSKSYLFGN